MAVVTAPAIAEAHQLHYGDAATNWRSTVTAVTPAAAVHATTGDATQRLTVSIHRATVVVILGYGGEPFVRLDRHGAWVNQRSPTTYAVAGPQVKVPADAADTATPRWRRVATTGTWTWHDIRTHWPGYALPPPVEQHPDRHQQVLAWSVPLIADGGRGAIDGALDWVPGPTGAFGGSLAALMLAAVVGLALVRRENLTLAAVTLALVAVDIVHSVGMVEGRVGGLGSRLGALPGHGVLPGLLWATAGATAVLLARRREAGLYLAAIVGALLCFTEGLPSLAVVWHSQYANALPGAVDRGLVAVLTGGGIGLFTAAVLLLVRSSRRLRISQPIRGGTA